MKIDCDVAIVGSGFSGSLMAMILKRLGCSVALLERGTHPRFAIGESSTPLANLLWEELCRRYDLPRLLPLSKWGTWQEKLPQIGCGLKRGFTFFHHEFDRPFEDAPDRRNELLIPASPHDRIADTHWYRPDFDGFLVEEAQHLGAIFVDRLHLTEVEFAGQGAVLRGHREAAPAECRARFVLDATGPRGFLHRQLRLPEERFVNFPQTSALFAHFKNVSAWPHAASGVPPYPPESAAVHHVFRGGWVWMLRFNSGITSAGAALEASLALDLNAPEGSPAWERLLDRLPSLQRLFAGARPVTPFYHQPELSFLSGAVCGERWALLPSAAGFVDPLFSTGFALTLLGIERLGELFCRAKPGTKTFAAGLGAYADATCRELRATAAFVNASYQAFGDFELFTSLSLLYFAAAIFSESARRLGRPKVDDGGFFLAGNPAVTEGLNLFEGACRDEHERQAFGSRIRQLIDPIDLAGLTKSFPAPLPCGR